MHLLQIANGDFFSTYGGGQVYVKNIVDEMIRQGMSVSVFSFVDRKSDVPYEKKEYKGIDLYEFYTKDRDVIEEVLERIKPDIIHAHAEKALFASIRSHSHKFVVTAHHGGITCPAGTLMNTRDEICRLPVSHDNCLACVLRNTKGGPKAYPFIKRLPLKLRLQLGRFLNKLPFIYFLTPYGRASLQIEHKMQEWKMITDRADRLIAPSESIAKNMTLNDLPEEKIETSPHGIPYSPNSLSICNNSHLKFFYVGRLSYIKGIHNLLKAFVQLDSSRCELHIVGDVSDRYASHLQAAYKKYPHIVFHGKISPDQVLDYIRQFDILVHPTICLEIYGLNIAEALSQGKPVIATRCGGAEMQIREKENGLLVEPNDVSGLRDAIQWMLDHPEERQRMAEQAPAGVIAIEEHIRSLRELYQEVLNR